MTKYDNGKIYTIRSYQTDKYYIGSTCSSLHKRLYQHRKDYERNLQGKSKYITSFEILQYDDAYIELLEEFECKSSCELHKREGEKIRENIDNVVNKQIAKKEHYLDNREAIIEQTYLYAKLHKEQKNKASKNYREKHTEIVKMCQKIYREENKSKLNEQSKQKYHNNPEKYKSKHVCECGGTYTYLHHSRHLKTTKHNEYVNQANGLDEI
ncbi:GIY-YIG nuclease family protein [Clostridium sp.]|uniref:GIY-YIG nuclease family protein n=1 Tax=Clostridium sp. TaxID=1506 RepID=UPI00284B14F3|nr:GIY-YIG nuclease family protein [Clostridium sp.]MDR3596478.1 hypothetical protein [Clostridium sp.]